MRLIHSITSLILLGFLALGSAHAQFEPVSCNGLPYNPDADCDGVIGTFDFLPFAALFGLEFTADFDSLTLPDYMDPDPTNELQWLAIDGDTLHLLLADSTIYSSVYIGGADGVDGMNGADGMDGADGADGLSAYDLWLAAGNTGSVEDFLAGLVGQDGADGEDGANGMDGADGADGLSAYEVWLAHGNEGTEEDFFESLTGPEGQQGPAGQDGADGANGIDGTNGTDGADGADGLSAYEIWLAAGNTGNEADFLASLVGQDGADGANGADGADGADGVNGLDGLNGADGADGLNGSDGADGLSAFEIWLAAGNTGNEADFLASLIGAPGEQGQAGAQGPEGPQGPQGDAGADGADGAAGLSAYEIWLGLGNTGTEEDFIAYLSGGAAFSPSVHGVFDSESDGNTFEIAEAIATVSIELWGASGGSGGDICGQTLGASSCNLCDATGGAGGHALKVVSMVYNLAQGDVLTLVPAAAGADSGELITCNPGLTGWTNWDCGPASSGADAGTTQLLLNGEVIAEISGGMGGTGACIGCQGDGCFNGDPGADGTLSGSANWMTVLSTETLEESTGSRVIFRY